MTDQINYCPDHKKNFIAKIVCAFILTSLCLPICLLAQNSNLRFERIGREQGLTANSVLSIAQDRQGFMWFCTEDGLFRYDGYGMTVYKHDPLDSTSLGNDQVFVILEDHTGSLWLGTAGGGLNRFDRTTEQFVRFKHDPHNLNSLSADVVSELHEDRSGDLWIGTWEGLNKLNLDSGQITRFMHDPENPTSMSPFWIRHLLEDRSGNLWVGTDGDLSRYDRRTGDFTHFFPGLEGLYYQKVNTVSSIFEDRSGMLWVGVKGALARFEAEQPHFAHFLKTIRAERVHSMFEDSRGAFWVGTHRALYHFSSTHDAQLLHGGEEPVGLEGHAIQDIYEDNTGTIWIATDQGVYRHDPGRYRFEHLINDPNDANSLSQNRVRSMAEDSSGALWIGLAGEGLNKYDPKTGQFQHSFPGLENHGFSAGPSRNYTIQNLHVDRFGVLWIGQWIGLGRYDPQKRQFKRFVHDPEDSSSLGSNNVQSIYEDHTGALWVGSFHDGPGRLSRFNREQENFTRFDLNLKNASGLNKEAGSVSSISEGRSGRLWFSTYGIGIYLFNRESETFTRFTHIPGDPNSLSNGWIGAVHEDQEGVLWAAPWYGGLNRLDPESGQVTIYAEKHGLQSNYISSITEDDQGRLWLAAKNGLSRFDPHSNTFKNFDIDDGLLNTDFNWNVSLKSRTGHVYFGGEKGIDYVHPDSIRDNPHIPPVVFTRFVRYNSGEASGQAIVEKGVTEKRRLNLSYQDHILTFEFASLNYRNSHKNQYAYKLEGFHGDWIQLGNKHEVTLTNLDPGEYTLRVKGSNNDGVWNDEGASLVINISPPWWQTTWAYLFYFGTALTLLYAVRKYELKRLSLRNALEKQRFESSKLKEVDEMKSRFFADISHEFRTPLTLILGPLQKFLSTTKEQEKREELHVMQRNAQRLQRLVDQLLDLSKIEAQRMPLRAQKNDIVAKIKEWLASFASLAESRNIKLSSSFSEQEIFVWFDAEKLEKVVFNLLGNALKFTPEGGEIKVAVGGRWGERESGRQEAIPCSPSHPLSHSPSLKITVRDSGVGIPSESLPHIFDRFYRASDVTSGEQGGTGIGLALAKEFVELHHGEIRVESDVGKGSIFTVLLPLGRGHLADNEIAGPVISDQYPMIGDQSSNEQPATSSQRQATSSQSERSEDSDHSGQSTTNNQQPRLLIVEDNPDMRRYLHQSLADGFAILEAENGKMGLQSAQKHNPDLIVSDVMMPQMDGFELCKKLKTDHRTSHIPVILLTARAGQEDKFTGLETGADDYLTKPFDARELSIRAKNLIEQRRKLRERFRREIIVLPREIVATSMDEVFLEKVIAAVDAHIDDAAFETDELARKSGYSRRQLNRKLRALTGQSVREFIRTIRLKRAAQLLHQNAATVTEVVFQVGFNNPGYFAKIFREQFGVNPSEYRQG